MISLCYIDAAGKKALYTGEFNDLGSILSKLDEIQPVDLVYLDNMITKQSGKIDEACPTVKKIRALVCYILELKCSFINFI